MVLALRGRREERQPRWLYASQHLPYNEGPSVPSGENILQVLRRTKSRVQNATRKTQSAGRRPCITRKYDVSYEVAGGGQNTENDADANPNANTNKKAYPASIIPENALIDRRIAAANGATWRAMAPFVQSLSGYQPVFKDCCARH